MERITSLPVIGLDGQVVRQVELPAEVTSFKIKPAVIHQVMVAEAAARRAGTAHTKVRSEVRGGGKKPWKQKGTGRARQGSTRSPQWVGGGVVHGPRKTRVYEQRTPIKLTRQARAGVVADYLTSGRVVVVEALPKELKTKQSAALLAKTKLRPGASLLVMLTTAEAVHRRAMRNLKGVTVAAVGHLGVYDGLQNSRWLVTEAGLGQLMHFVR